MSLINKWYNFSDEDKHMASTIAVLVIIPIILWIIISSVARETAQVDPCNYVHVHTMAMKCSPVDGGFDCIGSMERITHTTCITDGG